MAQSLDTDIDRTLSSLLQLRMMATRSDLGTLGPHFHARLEYIQTELGRIKSHISLAGDHYPSLERFSLRIRYIGNRVVHPKILESNKNISLTTVKTWPLPAQETFVQLMGSIHFKMWPADTPADLPRFARCLGHLPKHVPELDTSKNRLDIPTTMPRLITMAISQVLLEAEDFQQNLRQFLQALSDLRPPRTAQDPAIRFRMEWNTDKLALLGLETMRIYGLPGFRISIQVMVKDGMKSYEALCDTISELQDSLNREYSTNSIRILPNKVIREIFRYLIPRQATFARYRSDDGVRPHANIDQLGLFHGEPEGGDKVKLAVFQVNQSWRKTAGEVLREHTRLILHDDLHNRMWRDNIKRIDQSFGGHLLSSQRCLICQVQLKPRASFTIMTDYFRYSRTPDELSLGSTSILAFRDIRSLLFHCTQTGHDEVILRESPSSGDIVPIIILPSLRLEFGYNVEFQLTSSSKDVSSLQVVVEIGFEVLDHWTQDKKEQIEFERAAKRYKKVVREHLEEMGRYLACSRRLKFRDGSDSVDQSPKAVTEK